MGSSHLFYRGFEETDDKIRLYSLDLRTLDSPERKVRFRVDARPDMNLGGFFFPDKESVFYTSLRANRYLQGHFISPTDLSGGDEVSWDGLGGARLLDPLIHEPRNTLKSLYRSGHMKKADRYPDVIKVDVHDGSYQRILPNPGNIERWITDDAGNIRLGDYDAGDGGARGYLYRASNSDDWTEKVFPDQDRKDQAVRPLDFLADGRSILCEVYSKDGYAGIQVFDVETMKPLSKPIFRKPYSFEADGGGSVVRHHANNAIVGFTYREERRKYIYFDPGYRKLQASVDAAFPDLLNIIEGFTADGEYAIITSYGDTQPGVVSTLSMRDSTLKPILVRSPWIDRDKLSPMTPVSFPARDGALIYGYLTEPAKGTHKKGEPYPLITIVHGGPMVRDSWGYLSSVQYFASLGFGVLQVNYRGSTGYGEAYRGSDVLYAYEKGVWDVADGVRWAIAQGYADPKNIFIHGASFGGYSTAMSLIEEPDLYAAGVAAMGVYEWEMIAEEDADRNYTWSDDLYESKEGSRAERMHRWSPVFHADKITKPIMILHGGLDNRVNIRQARNFRDALKKAGIEHEYHETRWMVHGFIETGGKEQLDYYVRIASFFLDHLQ